MNDTISRQQTITALRALSDEDGYINVPHEVVTDVVRGLPPVRAEHGQTTQSEQGETDKLGVKTGETCEDCISRQAAIEVLSLGKEILSRVLDDVDVVGIDREKYSWGLGLIESYINDIKELPSAQSELIEKEAYIRGFEQGRTQGMIDSQGGKK